MVAHCTIGQCSASSVDMCVIVYNFSYIVIFWINVRTFFLRCFPLMRYVIWPAVNIITFILYSIFQNFKNNIEVTFCPYSFFHYTYKHPQNTEKLSLLIPPSLHSSWNTNDLNEVLFFQSCRSTLEKFGTKRFSEGLTVLACQGNNFGMTPDIIYSIF